MDNKLQTKNKQNKKINNTKNTNNIFNNNSINNVNSNKNIFLENALNRNKSKISNGKIGFGEKVKNSISGEVNQLIFVMLCVLLIVLVIVLYYYTFSKYSSGKLKNMDYKKKLKLEKLPICNEIDEKYRFFLCDYFIASSFNTPSVGNLHFDYVNKDIIK